jgi:hypothetical protein
MLVSSPAQPDDWSDRVRDVLARYDEPLLRQVAGRLLRPRNQWPVDELIQRSLDTLANAPVIDRRLKELSPACRKLLAVVGISRRPVWRVGQLLCLLAVLDHVEGLRPIQTLLEHGLLYPELPDSLKRLKAFEEWLGPSGITQARLFAHPAVLTRAAGEPLGLPDLSSREVISHSPRTSDGLEWPLRVAVAWQQLAATPIRLTQQNAFFKRDLQRLQTDPLLTAPFGDHLGGVADPGLLALELGLSAGLLDATEGELRAKPFSARWNAELPALLSSFWTGLFGVEQWDPLRGYLPADDNPFPSAALAVFLLLAAAPGKGWVGSADIARLVAARHPSWAATLNNKREPREWVVSLLLGLGFQLRFVEAAQEKGGWRFRLGDVGRHLLAGEPAPPLGHAFQQTLVVQPNGEIIAYRQGLTPELIAKLSRFATWKTLGAACTLELRAEGVYRGLESGLSLNEVLQLLNQRGTRALPPTVLDALQRWSNKRERISVYPAATLVEFTSPADLDRAFALGLVAEKLTERIGLAENGEIDYRQFRLVGNRDYEARPQQCARFEPDGVTLVVDGAQSDLLLEAELKRLAEPIPNGDAGNRRYLFTPASLRAAQSQGVSLANLEQWCLERSGEPLPSAIRLFCAGGGVAGQYRERLVVQLPDEMTTDGVVQWPATGRLVEERLGPCAIAVAHQNLEALRKQLAEIGVEVTAG